MLIGAIIGIANIIPGVSGGTMMVILNCYDKLIGAISSLKKNWRSSLPYLAAVGIGALIAIGLLSKGIGYLLEHQYMIINFFFIGIIIGSFPMIYKKATVDRFQVSHLIPFVVTLGIMILTMVFSPDNSAETVIRQLSLMSFVKLVICSGIAAICMIIPGISGSFMMLLFGVYTTVVTAIGEFNVLVLIPVVIGVLLGILLGAKLIDFLMKRYPQATYFAILGFVVGSVPVLFQKIVLTDNLRGGITLVISIVALILGAAVALVFDSPKFKKFFEDKNQKKEETV